MLASGEGVGHPTTGKALSLVTTIPHDGLIPMLFPSAQDFGPSSPACLIGPHSFSVSSPVLLLKVQLSLAYAFCLLSLSSGPSR